MNMIVWISLITNSIMRKPVVFVGNYLEIVKLLLSREYVELLKPKVIWIDYQVVPILELAKSLQNQPHLVDQFYFLELPTLNTLEQLLRSSELFSMVQHGFSTIIINIPQYCLLPHDNDIRLRELVKKINVILIMDQLFLPKLQIKLVQVESTQ